MRTEQGRAALHFGSSNDGPGQHSATGDRTPACVQLDKPLQTEAQTRQTLLAGVKDNSVQRVFLPIFRA